MSRMISIDIWTNVRLLPSNEARQGEGESLSEEAKVELRGGHNFSARPFSNSAKDFILICGNVLLVGHFVNLDSHYFPETQ